MKLTETEQKILRNLRKNKLSKWFATFWLAGCMGSAAWLSVRGKDILSTVDRSAVDPNVLMLFKGFGWSTMGLFMVLLGFVVLSLSRRTYSDALLLELYKRLEAHDQKDEA